LHFARIFPVKFYSLYLNMEFSTQEITLVPAEKLGDIASALIKTLLYFDVFNYPLTYNEWIENCQEFAISKEAAKQEVEFLVKKKYVQKQDGFYFISKNESLVKRRIQGNGMAQEKMNVAIKMSSLIAGFPFVEAVCISGSLSKNYMDESSDIDFFIITRPHRLWLCRGFLVAYKKLILLNSRKHFCVNYYLDSENLSIPDRNIFTATEIAFLKPTYNTVLFNKFMKANAWVDDFYPNKPRTDKSEDKKNNAVTKRFLEKVFQGFLGEKLDAMFFRLTLNRWQRKFPHFDAAEFDLNLRSKKNVSKHHPRGYQKIVLDSLQKKREQFEMLFNVKLH
jgi:hypothetical protein